METLVQLHEQLGGLPDYQIGIIGATLGVIGSCLLWLFGRLLLHRRWQRNKGEHILHLSLNTYDERVHFERGDGDSEDHPVKERYLLLDTLFEDETKLRITDPVALKIIERAIRNAIRTGAPLLHFGKHHARIMNMFRSEIAETRGGVSFDKVAGQDVARVEDIPCVFSVTYETWQNLRNGKMRIMLISQKDLMDTLHRDEKLRFEDAAHVDRPDTLELMYRDYFAREQAFAHADGDRDAQYAVFNTYRTMDIRIPVRRDSVAVVR